MTRTFPETGTERAVETIDFMTARWAHLPYEFLDHCSRRIINEIPRMRKGDHGEKGTDLFLI